MNKFLFRTYITFLLLTFSIGTKAQVSANFSKSGTARCVNSSVTFTDLSTGPVINWSWDFGDGGTSTLQSPSYMHSLTGYKALDDRHAIGKVEDEKFEKYRTKFKKEKKGKFSTKFKKPVGAVQTSKR